MPITYSWEDNESLLVNKTVIELSPTPGDLMLSKLVIDIFRISENMELVDRRRCSPKLMIFDTDNFLRSLCDRSHAVVDFAAFPFKLLLLALLLLFVAGNEGDGEVGGPCSNGNERDDLFFTTLSSCSTIVAGMWLLTLFDVNSICLSSSLFTCGCGRSVWELGLIGGVPGETMDIGGGGGGEGVGELIECWVVNANDSFMGESGGSDMQIDACCIDNLLSSWVDFCVESKFVEQLN